MTPIPSLFPLAWTLVVIAVLGSVAGAEDRPRLVLNTGGPIAEVRSLAFSSDSTRLYSAGLDKRVQSWHLPPRGNLDAVPQQGASLRWEISRGPQGIIYAIAASPVDDRLAIGGFNARRERLIVVYRTGPGTLETVLNDDADGPDSTVTSLCFSPGGERLTALDSHGQVRVWRTGSWEAETLRPPAPVAWPGSDPCAFISEDWLATLGGPNGQKLELFDLKRKGAEPATIARFAGRCMAIARDPFQNRWAAADAAGSIALFDGARNTAKYRVRKFDDLPDPFVRSLAFGRDGNLYALVLQVEPRRRSEIHGYDARSGELVRREVISATTISHAMAASPDGLRLATYSDEVQSVLMYELGDRREAWKRLELRGVGRRVNHVAFADEPTYRLGIGRGTDGPQKITEQFDLAKLERTSARNLPLRRERRWVDSTQSTDGWSLRILSPFRVQVSGPGGAASIDFDRAMQGEYGAHCWIHDGRGTTIAVAVTTRPSDGVFVYGLTTSNGPPPMLRHFRDHRDRVTSLTVSTDGRYLATGSHDQTIKIWSLEGLSDQPPVTRSTWGATFIRREDQVEVGSVLEAGIAAHRGLHVGDQIALARGGRWAAKLLGGGQNQIETRRADEILRLLHAAPLTEQVYVRLRRPGAAQETPVLLMPAWEPLATLFIDQVGEWAIWTPQGYYDSSSLHGDELFGWQINRGSDKAPDFFRADQFRGQLERPEVLRRLLIEGSLPKALRAADERVPEELESFVYSQVAQLPEIAVATPLDGVNLADDAVDVAAEVTFPSEAARRRYQVTAYLNGVPLTPSAVDSSSRATRLSWSCQAGDEFNRLRIVAVDSEGVGGNYTYKEVRFRAKPQRARKPKLHLLFIAADQYGAPGATLAMRRGPFGPLRYPIADAAAVSKRLRDSTTEFYDPGWVGALVNDQISRTRLAEVVTELQEQLRDSSPSDLLVVFVAGHGVAVKDEYYFIPPDERLAAARSNDELFQRIEEAAVPWTQLTAVRSLNCRKLFLIDTCFAGNALLEERQADTLKSAIRPLKRDDILVISGTGSGQAAYEDEKLQHGFFTKALLDGMDGAADRERDGRVDLAELARHVQQAVAEQTDFSQTPTYAPRDLFDALFVPLTQYR